MAAALHGEAAEGALKLWLADMDLPGCDAIRAALERRARHPTYGYTYQPPQMWDAVSRWLREQYHWAVPPDSLVFAPSVVTGFATALAAYTRPGDRVLLMTPLYEPLQAAVTGLGRVLVRFPLREGGVGGAAGEGPAGEEQRELQLDLCGRLEPLLPTVKLLLLCSPHNPAGRVWRRHELMSLAAACARHGVVVVEDAIWADWCLWGQPFVPLAVAAAEAAAETGGPPCMRVTFGAPSKSWNLGGLHAAWVNFSDGALRQTYLAQAEPAALTFGSAFATEGMAAAYTHGGPWLRQVKAYVQDNLAFVAGYLRAHVPEIEPLVPRATYLLWLDCSALGFLSADSLNRFMLEEARLLLSSGDSFAPEARSYQRLNCACSRPVLVETVSRLRRAVEKLRASRAPTSAPAFAPLSLESTPPDADTGTPGDATPASASPPRPNSSPRKTRWPEPPDPERYAEAGSLLEVLDAGHVRLLRASWLVELARGGGVLARRQELPDEAFLSPTELRLILKASGDNYFGPGGVDKVLPIVCISYMWDTEEHPDPTGEQLSLVGAALERELPKFAMPGSLGFQGFSDVGVFWDFGSLHQRPFGSEAEAASYAYARDETMDAWFAHQGTAVLMLTQHPMKRGSHRQHGYEESGWPTLERCCAEQLKQTFLTDCRWKLLVDLGCGLPPTLDDCLRSERYSRAEDSGLQMERGWPVGPDDFDLLAKVKRFRVASDREAACRLYRRLSGKNLGSVTKLSFEGMRTPTDADARSLGGCLNYCDALLRLDLQGVGMTESALQALLLRLERGSLPNLRVLRVDGVGEVGVLALAEALQFRDTAAKLDELHLGRNDASEEVKRLLCEVRAGLAVIQG